MISGSELRQVCRTPQVISFCVLISPGSLRILLLCLLFPNSLFSKTLNFPLSVIPLPTLLPNEENRDCSFLN